MRTVGQILKETRENKLYSLEEVEKATKIRKELLVALESDNFSKLPPPTYVQGFIKNYAKFLNLDQGKMLAVFRREFSDKKHQPYVMEVFANPIKKSKFKITPGRTLGLVVLLIIVSFFVYLWFQYRQFVGSPSLMVFSPVDQLTTDNPEVVVQGKADPEVKVTVNGQDITVGIGGDFKETVALSSQVNKITVAAISKSGQRTQMERIVYLKR